jgi:hypothetical protein
VNQNTLDFARYQQAAARTGGEIAVDHPNRLSDARLGQ